MESNTSEASGSTQAPKQPPRRGLPSTTRDLALASIGIVGVLGDEAQALYERSVERGRGTVKSVREWLKRAPEPLRRPDRPAGRRWGRSQGPLIEVEATVARMNFPTEADIDALTRQIAELEAKIDQLSP